MINSTNLRALQNLEFFQVVSNVLQYLKDEKSENESFVALRSDLEVKLAALDQILVLARGNVRTEKLQTLDRDRDTAFRAFYTQVKTYANFPDTQKAEASSLLLREIDKYGRNLDKLGYNQQSGALVNLFQDLDTEENQARIVLLHVSDWYVKLKEAQKAFNEVFTGRETDNAARLLGDTTQRRSEVQNVFDRLGKFINAYEIINDTTTYGTLCDKVNEAVKYALQQVGRRVGRKSSSKEETTEGTDNN
ncbi:MAG: DUF6261 family protein [Oscillibacter sp.]|nr:DUF6261 family protein [Oscillibacter sp.]